MSLTGIHDGIRDDLGFELIFGSVGDQFLYLLTVNVVFGISFGFALHNACHNCKRQLEQTDQRESPR